MAEQIPLAPISGWELELMREAQTGIVTLRYFVSGFERAEQAHASPRFAFQPDQLRQLARRLADMADELERPPTSTPLSPRH